MSSLRTLVLASNNISGNLPDLSALEHLQVVDMAGNSLGPEFPPRGRKVASVVLAGNKFSDALPEELLASCYHLERLDISSNKFVGPFPPALLSLPSIEYLSIAGNRFSGKLSGNTSYGENRRFVDLSSNLLTGSLPACLVARNSGSMTMLFSANSLSVGKDDSQHPSPFCQNQALAVGIVPEKAHKKPGAKGGLVAAIVAAVLGGALVAGAAIFFAVRKASTPKARPPWRLLEHASRAYPSNLLADAHF